jgi:plastocyanin
VINLQFDNANSNISSKLDDIKYTIIKYIYEKPGVRYILCSKMFRLLALFASLPVIITCTFYYNDISFNYAYAEGEDENSHKKIVVTIPKGSANPEVDITKLGPRQWYLPRQITVHTNNTITWTNNDTEAHTVTSGISAGIESLMNNKRGTPNGIFDSGSFKPGQSWTHIFNNSGTYTYFCSIHPWMEGVVRVQGTQAQNIPNYPVDASGKRISQLPMYQFTPNGKLEVGLSWDPGVLLTGKEISFFVSFFDRANNKPNLLPFDFVLIQNGKQNRAHPKHSTSWSECASLYIS